MAEKTVRGQFVWHDLMTPDPAGAQTFYTKVLGWKTEAWDQDPSYSMFAAASGPLGGSAAQPTGTPHWLHYIGTPDIEATVQQVTGLGGSVVKEITSLPNGGRYAVLTDPQGATFGVYGSESDEARADAPPRRGEFSWHELATTDCQAAFDFYSAVFGWEKAAEHDMGPMGVYLIFARNGNQLGGMFNKSPEMKGNPAWLGYVRVKDVHQAVQKVKSARGTLINGPMEVPGGDWIAQFTDPYGAMFAVHMVAADLKAAAPAAASAAPAAAPAESATAKSPVKKAATKKTGAKKKAAAGKSAAARRPAKKKAAARKGAARRKAGAKKAAPKKKAASKKKAVAKSAKRPVRKAARAAKKAGRKKVAAGKKRSAAAGRKKTRRARKAK